MLSVLNIKSEKDLDQVKTKTRSLEKEFKDIKPSMNRTGEEGASRIKKKMEGIYDILDQHLSERDSIDPSKIKVLASGFESTSANESFGMLTDDSKFEHPLMQRETQTKSTTQIRKKRKVESNDKSKTIELLKESVENQNRKNEVMIEATKELKNGMTEPANIMVSSFKDVMKCLLEQKKRTFVLKATVDLSVLF